MKKRANKSNLEPDLNKALEQISLEALDENLKGFIKLLLNKIEEQELQIKDLHAENQKLKDDNNRLKGEQGKPNIRPQISSQNISSESERKALNREKTKQSKAKNHKLRINRVETCSIDKSALPADAIFKGCRSVIVQDIVIHTDVIEFQREIYYSPSAQKTFIADLPKGYEGQFGPGVKAYILSSHYESNMTESAIVKTLRTHGLFISACTVSRMLTDNKDPYHAEKEEIVAAGLSSSLPKQMDDTGARVKGKNQVAHILCNAWYTSYFTRPHKDRLTLLEILNQGPLTYKVNDLAYALMTKLKVSAKWLHALKEHDLDGQELNSDEMETFLHKLLPDPQQHQKTRKAIEEASAIAAYRAKPKAISVLLSDEAPQFDLITDLQLLAGFMRVAITRN